MATAADKELPFSPCVVSGWKDAVDLTAGRDMKNFANAAFAPDMIEAMTAALGAAVSTLPEPLHSAHVDTLAQSILRTASTGERNVAVLQRIALMELSLCGGDMR